MTVPADYFREIIKPIAIFRNKDTALFWRVEALKNIAERARIIIDEKYDLKLRAIFLEVKASPRQKKEVEITIDSLALIDAHYSRALFFSELFNTLQTMKNDNDPQLEMVIKNNTELMELLSQTGKSINLLKQYLRKIINLARLYQKNSPLFKKM